MNRRAFLAAAPAAVAVPPVTALSNMAASPIMVLFREYQRLSEAAQAHVCIDDDEDAELWRLFYHKRDQIVGRIRSLPSVCASDFAAKLIVDTCQGMLFSEWETGDLWREARACWCPRLHGGIMNRRAVLADFPAAVLVAGDARAQDVETPVMVLFRSWKAMFDFVEGPAMSGCTDAERAPFHERETELVRQIIETPALDALDVCAKLTAYTCDGQHFANDEGLLSDTILREARMVSQSNM